MATFKQELAAAAGTTAEEMTQKLFEKVGGVSLGRMAQPEESVESENK